MKSTVLSASTVLHEQVTHANVLRLQQEFRADYYKKCAEAGAHEPASDDADRWWPLTAHDHSEQAPSDESYWVDGCAITHGRCDECGAPCNRWGCTADRAHKETAHESAN